MGARNTLTLSTNTEWEGAALSVPDDSLPQPPLGSEPAECLRAPELDDPTGAPSLNCHHDPTRIAA